MASPDKTKQVRIRSKIPLISPSLEARNGSPPQPQPRNQKQSSDAINIDQPTFKNHLHLQDPSAPRSCRGKSVFQCLLCFQSATHFKTHHSESCNATKSASDLDNELMVCRLFSVCPSHLSKAAKHGLYSMYLRYNHDISVLSFRMQMTRCSKPSVPLCTRCLIGFPTMNCDNVTPIYWVV